MRALALLTSLVWVLCAGARAQDSTAGSMPHLSDRGRQMLDGTLGGSWSNEREPGLFYRAPRYNAFVQPSWVYFLRDRVGLGLYLGYALQKRSSGLDRDTSLQGAPTLSNDANTARTDRARLVDPWLEHDLSAGMLAAFELPMSDRISLFVRPYVGVSIRWQEWVTGSSNPVTGSERHVGRQRHVYAQAGLRLPLVYQFSPSIGLGLGPDVTWESLPDAHTPRLGFSSWIARVF